MAPVMMAMLSSRDVLPPPCGPTSAMARGAAFIRVECSFEFSGVCFWDMCASAFKDQWLCRWFKGGSANGHAPFQMGNARAVAGLLQGPATTCHKICPAPHKAAGGMIWLMPWVSLRLHHH